MVTAFVFALLKITVFCSELLNGLLLTIQYSFPFCLHFSLTTFLQFVSLFLVLPSGWILQCYFPVY